MLFLSIVECEMTTTGLDTADNTPRSPTVTEVVYVWPDGREEVRYRRPFGSSWACDMMLEVEQMSSRLGAECPYSYRHV